jgi:hypothetical protein
VLSAAEAVSLVRRWVAPGGGRRRRAALDDPQLLLIPVTPTPHRRSEATMGSETPPTVATDMLPRLDPVRSVRTDVLEIAYHEAGPSEGETVLLLHGFPYDIHTYADVIPQLVAAGRRVIVPYLRGHGPTRFLDGATPRSGQQAALGADVIALMDALSIPRAILAGHDWGGRAACIVAALWPERCHGLVSVNGYLIQDIAAAMTPISKPASGTSTTS